MTGSNKADASQMQGGLCIYFFIYFVFFSAGCLVLEKFPKLPHPIFHLSLAADLFPGSFSTPIPAASRQFSRCVELSPIPR